MSRDAMTAILQQSRSQELFPEPFRLQENTAFLVSFDVYIEYVKSLSDDSPVQLTYGIPYLRTLVASSNTRMYSAFLADMAFAICKEISFSEEWYKPSSLILPTDSRSTPRTVSDFAQMYSSALVCEEELFDRINRFGYKLKRKLTERNTQLFHMAVLLYHLSKLGSKVASAVSIVP